MAQAGLELIVLLLQTLTAEIKGLCWLLRGLSMTMASTASIVKASKHFPRNKHPLHCRASLISANTRLMAE